MATIQYCFPFNPELLVQNSISINKKSISLQRPIWTNEENQLLLKHVDEYGPKNWKKIAETLQTKNAKQCRDHYFNSLDPTIINSIWTNEEEKILLSKYQQYGPHWSKIKDFLPGRTQSMIKVNLVRLLKKRNLEMNRDKNTNNKFDITVLESLLNFH